MKQHITEKQLNELSKQAKKKLMKWWLPHTRKDGAGYYVALPQLNMGQMIEFLDENNRGHEGANILPFVKNFDKEGNYIDVKPVDEWCDALWEAVREVIEDEKSQLSSI